MALSSVERCLSLNCCAPTIHFAAGCFEWGKHSRFPIRKISLNVDYTIIVKGVFQCLKEVISVIFDQTKSKTLVRCKVGDNLMRVAQRNGVDIEGACEGSLACCTCHVYIEEKHFERMDSLSEEEEDMLDLAPFLKANSRLSCQITLAEQHDGMEVSLPPATRNFYVDGFVPKPH